MQKVNYFRRVCIASIGCIALVAFLSSSATAQLITDYDCDGDPYRNYDKIHEFEVDTYDSQAAYQPSGLSTGALFCGTRLIPMFPYNITGIDTLYKRADIDLPLGVRFTNTSGIPLGSYVGEIKINAFTVYAYMLFWYINESMSITVDSIGSGDCPGSAVACYRAEGRDGKRPGYLWLWVARNAASGRTTLTIGQLHPWGVSVRWSPTGITRFNLQLCQRIGDPTTGICGSGADTVVHTNGAPSAPNCLNGNGIYTITAEQRGGTVAGPESTCVEWGLWHTVP